MPLTADSATRLGLTFGVDSYYGGRDGMSGRAAIVGHARARAPYYRTYIEQQHELRRIYGTLAATTNPTGC